MHEKHCISPRMDVPDPYGSRPVIRRIFPTMFALPLITTLLLLVTIWSMVEQPHPQRAGDAQVQVQSRGARDYLQEARRSASRVEGEILLSGLEQDVEVLRDRWGIPHIYGKTVHDLFMAQGFVAAQDRLWQMEMWRRIGEGRMAEILGPSALPADRLARLVRYRGNMESEWKSYAPDARQIIEAFVEGVNANIALRRDSLPFEFRIMGISPEPWTPEVCLTRMAGFVMTRNASNELVRAQLVRAIGAETASELWPPDPHVLLDVPHGLDLDVIDFKALAAVLRAPGAVNLRGDEGSNNWTLTGRLTATGRPILANDPHRTIALPSLRYIAHLVGPGWNVIGAGEPSLPGVAAGHNERVAFGFTIVGIDQQDLYVEFLNPESPLEYLHRGRWTRMQVAREPIRVKGRTEPEVLELHYTIHGPVLHEDGARNRAYVLRWVGSEPGTAGYLASLSLNRVRNWREFLEALERWKVPSENLVYADIDGNIGWQAAGLAPIRKGWQGLLPVPGSGEYEWQGFLDSAELPKEYNPPRGYIATANHNILPPGYRHVLGYEWSAIWRYRRIEEVLRATRNHTIADSERLQHDEVSLPARVLVELLGRTNPSGGEARAAVRLLANWDCVLRNSSTEAAIFEMWVRKLVPLVWAKRLSPEQLSILGNRASLDMVLRWLQAPTEELFGPETEKRRDQSMIDALALALADLNARFGSERKAWAWGRLHQALFLHGLGRDDELKRFLDRGPVPRGGDGTTVNATSFATDFRQTGGASYRQIMDLSDWDRSVGINVPGQSGEPGSAHYDDLLSLWAQGQYHPLAYSRAFVEKVTAHRLTLSPGRRIRKVMREKESKPASKL